VEATIEDIEAVIMGSLAKVGSILVHLEPELGNLEASKVKEHNLAGVGSLELLENLEVTDMEGRAVLGDMAEVEGKLKDKLVDNRLLRLASLEP